MSPARLAILLTSSVALAACSYAFLRARARVSRRSPLFFGRTLEEERALAAACGVDLRRFYQLAQRLMWGVLQADLIKVDVPAVSEQLRREFDDFFVTHLILAFVARAGGDKAAGETALARARARVTPEHPFAYLMPSAEEWACEAPPSALREVVPGRVWRHTAHYSHGLVPFLEFSTATILKLRGGDLIILNPVGFSGEVVAQINAIGRVTHLITPTKFHNLFIESSRAQFPGARVYGVRGHRDNPPSADIAFDGFLDDARPLFPDELDQVTTRGNEIEEVLLYHRATKTLIVHDIAFWNLAGVPGFSFWWRLYGWVWGVHDTVALPGYQIMMWTRFWRFRAALRTVLSWDIERMVSGHAPWNALPTPAGDRARAVFGWVSELSMLEYLIMVTRFFRGQPGFLRDLLRYMVAQKL